MLEVPITALGLPSRELLCELLDPEKAIPSTRTRGHPRDWRGLAALAKIPGQHTSGIYNSKDCRPTEKVLRLWSQQKDNTATVGKLQEFLQALDRWDVYDDTFELFAEDVRVYSKQQENAAVATSSSPSADHITCHDVALYKSGSRELQRYSAYILYAKEDFAFACKMIKEMKSRGHWVCCEEDLLAGFTTVMEPVIRLISERCDHLIVIFSPDFLESGTMKFYTDYAQALGIKTDSRKLVPCVYLHCELPSSFSMYYILYYDEEENEDGSFWDSMSRSIAVVSELSPPVDSLPSAQLTEVAICTENSPAASMSASPSAHAASWRKSEPDLLELPSLPANLDSLTSGTSISELSLQRETNLIKKFCIKVKSKLKKEKANPMLTAVSSAV